MNPSSLDIDLWLRRAKGSAEQRHKEMNRNHFGDELGKTNQLCGSGMNEDEDSPSTIENVISARQQPERSGAHEADEGGRITYQ